MGVVRERLPAQLCPPLCLVMYMYLKWRRSLQLFGWGREKDGRLLLLVEL